MENIREFRINHALIDILGIKFLDIAIEIPGLSKIIEILFITLESLDLSSNDPRTQSPYIFSSQVGEGLEL